MTTCSQCGQSFTITSDDLAFYDKISPVFAGKKYAVPPPKMCPDCRMQRRLSYRNERSLYHRKCDLSGKQIISIYPPNSPFKVYDFTEWHSDKWDASAYGLDINVQQSFSEQFFSLRKQVPRMCLIREGENINSDYCNRVSYSKNNYLLFSSSYNEDCLYCTSINDSRTCMDCLFVDTSELLYDSIDSHRCYASAWLTKSQNCSDSFFLTQCYGCKHCLFCTNLVQKEYCIFNTQYTKEQFTEECAKINFSRHSALQHCHARQHEIVQNIIVKSTNNLAAEQCTGNNLSHCRHVYNSFDCRNVENGKYVQSVVGAKDVMDFSYWGRNVELVYETQACGLQSQHILFCNECWIGCDHIAYCDSCIQCQYCFGCVGLRHKKYCIFNRQYTKDEYDKLVPALIDTMQKLGEWGEFFSIAHSPFAYNETVAQDYFPLTHEEVRAKKWQWHEEEKSEHQYLGPASVIPDDIKDVPDDICQKILLCEVTQKPYKIIPQELAFYKQMNIPVPRKCPDQRYKERFALRNPRKLWSRTCMKCSKSLETTYSPDRPEIVYCEECYLKEVY